ncbi:MAG: response regulator [Bacteroidales bacterium]|nr:response regulator [Bacteroidales bacterium]
MKLNNLNISTQLRLGFSTIIFLILILGSISWIQTKRLAQQTTEMFDHPFTVFNALRDLEKDVLVMQRAMKDLPYAGNEDELLDLLQVIDVRKVDALKKFDVLYDRYLGPRADIDKAYQYFVEWNVIRDETVRLMRFGNKDEAVARTMKGGIGAEHVDELIHRIQIIDQFARNKGNSYYLNAMSLSKSWNSQLLGWFVGFILVIMLLVYLLIRNINRPLTELIAVTQQFKDGKMDGRCHYAYKNEFGRLAASFNKLADTIEDDYKLNIRSSNLAAMMLKEEDAHRFCHSLLRVLIEDTWSQMGAIYLLSDDKTQFENFECIGMNVAGCKPFSATKYGGEFGHALATKKMQYITSIPEDSRFTFSTVTGEFMPREIITIPILSNEEVVAVLSLVNIKRYSKNSLRLLESISGTLNARMAGILAHRKIVAFSQRLEYQNIELETQKKELSAQTSELQEQNMELEMQKKQLDESNKLKTSFLSNMSHELRTPLNSVIALSGVLNRRLAGKIPEEEYSYLDVIERNGRNLLLLINDILDLSRIESGREETEISSFNPNDLIHDIIDMIEPQAVQKNISLRYVANNLLPNIESDYEKALHILQNLVGNAVKFTEKGFVEVTAQVKDESLLISVSDTGIGIEEEDTQKIFDEFRQVDGSNSRKYGGTGLGLSISKKYAEILGGYIEVKSIYGKGSTFTIHLPVHFGSQQTNVKTEVEEFKPTFIKPGKSAGQVNVKDKTILLVEDTEAVIIQMKDILETHGYQMMVARNGNEALELIALKKPDGLILDLMMPEVDGFEVLKCIREEEKSDRLPVIILTAKYVTKQELSFLKHNHIHQLIHKGDINKKQLLEAVDSMVCIEADPIDIPVKQRIPLPVSGTPVVLVIEDNLDNMLTIKALLSGKCEVLEAEDGIVGIEMAKNYHPNLILMDIALPGINGVEVLNELNKEMILKDIPVIAVSASAMKGDRENFMACGFDDYISKPIDHQLFIQVLDKWI